MPFMREKSLPSRTANQDILLKEIWKEELRGNKRAEDEILLYFQADESIAPKKQGVLSLTRKHCVSCAQGELLHGTVLEAYLRLVVSDGAGSGKKKVGLVNTHFYTGMFGASRKEFQFDERGSYVRKTWDKLAELVWLACLTPL